MLSEKSQGSSSAHDTKALQLGLLAADMEKIKSEVSEMGRIQRALVEGVEGIMGRRIDRLRQEVVMVMDERFKVRRGHLNIKPGKHGAIKVPTCKLFQRYVTILVHACISHFCACLHRHK